MFTPEQKQKLAENGVTNDNLLKHISHLNEVMASGTPIGNALQNILGEAFENAICETGLHTCEARTPIDLYRLADVFHLVLFH